MHLAYSKNTTTKNTQKSFQINSKRRRAKSFETCCQWALLNVQVINLVFPSTVQKYIYPPVSKTHAGSFRVSVIHRTLTWTTGSLTCVRSYACVYTRGWGTQTRSQRNILTWKNSHKCVLCFGRDSLSLQHPPLSLQPLSRLSNVWTRRDRNTVLHPACPTRGSNPGSWDMNSDAVTTEPRPPQETRVA